METARSWPETIVVCQPNLSPKSIYLEDGAGNRLLDVFEISIRLKRHEAIMHVTRSKYEPHRLRANAEYGEDTIGGIVVDHRDYIINELKAEGQMMVYGIERNG